MIDLNGMAITFRVPSAGTYCIGIAYGTESSGAFAVIMKAGEKGTNDEVVQVFQLDRATGKWIAEGEKSGKPEVQGSISLRSRSR